MLVDAYGVVLRGPQQQYWIDTWRQWATTGVTLQRAGVLWNAARRRGHALWWRCGAVLLPSVRSADHSAL